MILLLVNSLSILVCVFSFFFLFLKYKNQMCLITDFDFFFFLFEDNREVRDLELKPLRLLDGNTYYVLCIAS